MPVTVFADVRCLLGEGIFFDEYTRNLYWVDIDSSHMYKKNVDIENAPVEYMTIGILPSVILNVVNDRVFFADKLGLAWFDWSENNIERVFVSERNGFRSNDGVLLESGDVLFGMMHLLDSKNKGSLIKFGNKDCNLLDNEIHIPNTFVEIPGGVLISDSFTQKTYLYDLNLNAKKMWGDFTAAPGTPDGGCFANNTVLIAFWNGARIGRFNECGYHLYDIAIPALRPTNCVVVDETRMFVTTARGGMTETELLDYPLSGSVFEVCLNES